MSMLERAAMGTDKLLNQYQSKLLSHVYYWKVQTKTFATLPLQYDSFQYSKLIT